MIHLESPPREMRAITLDERGALSLQMRPTPALPTGLLTDGSTPYALVRVEGFGINRADLLQRDGHYPPPPGVSAEILGLEFTGRIVEVTGQSQGQSQGLNHSGLQLERGARVMGICAGEAYAEYIVTPLDQLIPVPGHFSIAEAASFAETHLTAFDALTSRGAIAQGSRVLIHAIGSGVGTAAAHLASLWGAEVVGTTRSSWKRDRALAELPVSEVWLTQEGLTPPRDARPFDLIIDFVGAAYLKQNVKLLALEGRLVLVGLLGGTRAELNLGLLLAKRARVVGTTLRARSALEKIELTQRFIREVYPNFTPSGAREELPPRFAPPSVACSAHISDASDVEAQHARMRSGEVWSKLACVW